MDSTIDDAATTGDAATAVASERDATTLALLREWQSVCDATIAGENHLLIRKGGLADGRDGFEVRRNFFGLLPTLFHQAKTAAIDVPPPPSTVSIVCQLVDAFVVPSTTDLSTLAPFHAYTADQLAARQRYKPERPLHLILIRAFALRRPVDLDPSRVRPVCKSWSEATLARGLGGIDAATPIERSTTALDAARRAIAALTA